MQLFAILVVAHLVWKIEERRLEHHHEGDPLVERGLRGLLRAPIFLLHDALEVALVGGGDVGTAVDPAVVLRQV